MRLTERKKRILSALDHSNPSGISLLNELRVKCSWAGEFSQARSRKSDQRRSFNRTLLESFEGIHISHLSDDRGFDTNLSVGLFARWAIWELIDQGYLTYLPEPDEMEIAVGRDACAAFVKLKHSQFAVIGTAIFMSEIIIVGSRTIEEKDLWEIAKVPWSVKGYKDNAVDEGINLLVSELVSLPSIIILDGKTCVSTAKKKFSIY